MKKSFKILISLVIVILMTACSQEISKDNTKKIELGTWQGNVYTNVFLNVKYTMSDSWKKDTNEELAELMDTEVDTLTDNEKLSKEDGVYHFMVKDETTGDNVILLSEKASVSSMKTYVNSLKTQLKNVTNMKYTIGEEKDETVNGIKYKTLEADCKIESQVLKQKYYIVKNNGYFTSIIVTNVTTDDSEFMNKIINSFEKLN